MAGVFGVLADFAIRFALGVEVISEERFAARFREADARGLGVLAIGVERGGGSGVR